LRSFRRYIMSKASSNKRKSSSQKTAYWRNHVDAWRESELSQAEYSRRAGVSHKALGYWKRRFDREPPVDGASPTIVSVPMPPSPEPQIPPRPIVVHTRRGTRLEIGGDFHPEVLEKVLRVLEQLS
jgi:hypothetical protein